MARRCLPLLALVALSLAASDASAARRRGQRGGDKSCKKDERLVEDGTPVLGGPGLGFPTIAVAKQDRCARVLKSSEDGSFALILVESDRVGWVATGLVDAALSEADADVKPVPFEPTARPKLLALEPTALRAEPRFDAPAARALQKGEPLTALGASPDQQWLYVSAGQGSDDKGWIPKYQAADAMPDPEKAPTAGSGPWAPVKLVAIPGAVQPSDPEEEKRAAALAKKLEGLPEVKPPEAPEPPLLGRRQSIAARARVASWRQEYASDAVDDPYARYVLQSTGAGFSTGYAYRGDGPLVVDVALAYDQLGFAFRRAEDQVEVYTPAGVLDGRASAGLRLVGTREVDVEAALGYALTAVWVGDLVDAAQQPIPAFATGVHHSARPSLSARGRVGGGALGLLVLEAGLPVGLYQLVPDPADRYTQQDKAIPDERRPGLGPDADPPKTPQQQATTILHLGIGVDARVGYAIGLTESLLLEVAGTAGVRQALIAGPGLRTAPYGQASTVDAWAGLEVGGAFAF